MLGGNWQTVDESGHQNRSRMMLGSFDRTGHNRIGRLRKLIRCQRASSYNASGGACQALYDLSQIRPAILNRFIRLGSLHASALGGVGRA
jgi:hypothetical protein